AILTRYHPGSRPEGRRGRCRMPAARRTLHRPEPLAGPGVAATMRALVPIRPGSDPISGSAPSNSRPWRCVVMIKATGTGAADERAQLSDEALLVRYRDQGRPEDFEALINRYRDELYRYLNRYLGDRTLSEDVFQNTFLQIHLKRGLYEEG